MERHLELAEIYELPAAPGVDGGAEGMQRVIAAFSRVASAMADSPAIDDLLHVVARDQQAGGRGPLQHPPARRGGDVSAAASAAPAPAPSGSPSSARSRGCPRTA